MERIIAFGKFLTGHDTETVEQLYNDWLTPTAKTAISRQAEQLVMPMFTEDEANSGWESWLNNSFKAYKKDFSDKLRKLNKRSGLIETPKKWIESYYKELLEITERYLNASKHSA